jgi:hypothetical protein
MVKIFRKSDWGDYWFPDYDLDDDGLKDRSLLMLSKFAVTVARFDADQQMYELSKEIYQACRTNRS